LIKLRTLLTKLEIYFAAGSLFLLLVLSLGQIVARNFFNTGIPAADTLARHLVLYVTFFGAVLAVEYRSHIKIDVVTAWLSPSTLDKLFRPIHLFCAVVCGYFAVAAARFWSDEWQYAAAGDRWTSMMDLILPVGFGLLCLHFLFGALMGPQQKVDRS
jgi:TRAP-type C4-dicarboxylate transport system permease small subunit